MEEKRKQQESFDDLQKKKKRKLQSSEERQKEWANPAKSTPQTGNKKRRKKDEGNKKGISKIIGMFLVIIQAVLTILFTGAIFKFGMLPEKYVAIVVGILVLLLIITYATQRRQKRRAIPGKILSVLISAILAVGCYYLGMVNGAFDAVTGGEYKIDNMVVAVLIDDPAETIEDAKDYSFAVQYSIGASDVKQAVSTINKELGTEINIVEYADVQAQAEALHGGEVDAIIYNEGYTGMLEEAVEGYSSSVKIIYRHEIKKEIQSTTTSTKVNTAKNAFSVYISGIDVYGPIETNSRSDVNIIATVNPETHQILLTTTPRDYYVTIPGISNGQRDKLTHAGIYGVDASMATLENLYETSIPFYVRVNFTSVIEIVDELGGVDVYSEYAFTTNDGTLTVKEGMNHFNGKQALAFSRERYNVPGGDNQRGKNQQAVIVAMIKKMISPQMLTSASGIINSVSGNVETNMTQAQIQNLIKAQLNKGGSWNIYSVAATGTGDSNSCYSSGSRLLYVMNPNQESVNEIVKLIKRVEDGEILDGSEVAQ